MQLYRKGVEWRRGRSWRSWFTLMSQKVTSPSMQRHSSRPEVPVREPDRFICDRYSVTDRTPTERRAATDSPDAAYLASPMLAKTCRACATMSPGPTRLPPLSSATCPAMNTSLLPFETTTWLKVSGVEIPSG
jgi:hypothetical protein